MIFNALRRWFDPDASALAAHRLYLSAVQQARQPGFYAYLAVEDTIDGRFDLITLHVFLLSRTLAAQEQPQAEAIRQQLIDLMLQDMDQSLREMGVGDVGISKKIQKMAYALNGRMEVYETHWEDQKTFIKALWRNVYRGDETCHQAAGKLATYCVQAENALKLQSMDDLSQGHCPWPEPEKL